MEDCPDDAGSTSERSRPPTSASPSFQPDAIVEGEESTHESVSLRYVPVYRPSCRRDHDTGYAQQGNFEDHGEEQLVQWIAEALQRLPSSTQVEMAEYFQNADAKRVSIGTVCSGTDAPVLVAHSFAKAVKQMFSINLVVDHRFSCESNKKKQRFLMQMFGEGDIQLRMVLSDASCLKAGAGSSGQDVITGSEVRVPPCKELEAHNYSLLSRKED